MHQHGILSSGRIKWPWLLALAAAIFYLPFLGGVHLFDWDEVNFAEASREMLVTGDFLNIQIDYKPFFEKPPFFFWLQSVAMKLFGISEFSARFPNAIAGILTLVFLFFTGKRWIDNRFGVLWALSFGGSLLPALYHKSGIIDPWFNLFIFSSIVSWMEAVRRPDRFGKLVVLSGILSAIAVLTKGPVGPLLIGLTVLIMRLVTGEKKILQVKGILLFIAGNLAVAGLWFATNWIARGPQFISAFLVYQAELLTQPVAGHKGFPGYHFVVLLIGVFPASIFALGAFSRKMRSDNPDQNLLRQLMIVLLMVVVVVFTIVQSKIVHYSSLAYYPLAFLSAWVLVRWLDGDYKWPKWQKGVAILIAFILMAAFIGLPVIGINMGEIKAAIQTDPFTAGTLEADVNWPYHTLVPAVLFIGILTTVIILWRKRKKESGILALYTGMALLVNIALIAYIGRIEGYSQRALVEFCQSFEGQQVDIKTIGFRSYVPFFYAKKPLPDSNTLHRPTYYILKADKMKKLEEYPDLKLLYEKNGYLFFSQE